MVHLVRQFELVENLFNASRNASLLELTYLFEWWDAETSSAWHFFRLLLRVVYFSWFTVFLFFETPKKQSVFLRRPFNRSKYTFEAISSEPSLRSPMWLRFMQCFDTRIKAHTAGVIVLFEWYILFVSSSLLRTCLILLDLLRYTKWCICLNDFEKYIGRTLLSLMPGIRGKSGLERATCCGKHRWE